MSVGQVMGETRFLGCYLKYKTDTFFAKVYLINDINILYVCFSVRLYNSKM